MIPRIVPSVLLAFTLLVLPGFAHAGQKSKPRPTPNHHHVTIESVSATSITISEPGGLKTFKIASTTEITYRGQTVPVDQLQPGMRVKITPDSVDETVAGDILADEAPVDPPPPASSKN
jgi:hypothetical protein